MSKFHREGRGPPTGTARFVFGDPRLVAQGQGDVIQPFEQTPASVVVDLERDLDLTDRRSLGNQIDRRRYSRLRLDGVPQALGVLLGDDAREQALLARVSPEDVREPGAQNDAEAEVTERPDGMFA